MTDPAANGIGKRHILQELAFLIDDQRPCRHIIFHFHFLDLCCIFHGKGHFFCFQIPVRSQFFPERVSLAYSQPFNQMFFAFHGSPTVNHISVFIQDGQLCALQLHAGCEIRLFHRNFSRFIFIFRGQFHHRDLLPLVLCGHFYHFIGRNISVRSRFFFDVVSSKRQVIHKYGFPVFIRQCLANQRVRFHNHFAVCQNILFGIQPKDCAFHSRLRFRILFHHGYFHFLSFIPEHRFLFNHRRILVFVGKSHRLGFPIQHKTFRCGHFHDLITSKRKV